MAERPVIINSKIFVKIHSFDVKKNLFLLVTILYSTYQD